MWEPLSTNMMNRLRSGFKGTNRHLSSKSSGSNKRKGKSRGPLRSRKSSRSQVTSKHQIQTIHLQRMTSSERDSQRKRTSLTQFSAFFSKASAPFSWKFVRTITLINFTKTLACLFLKKLTISTNLKERSFSQFIALGWIVRHFLAPFYQRITLSLEPKQLSKVGWLFLRATYFKNSGKFFPKAGFSNFMFKTSKGSTLKTTWKNSSLKLVESREKHCLTALIIIINDFMK